MADIDQSLVARTNALVNRFNVAIARLAGPPVDLRVFFTFAHCYITKKIAQHIDLFANPNSLMRLNEIFATTYLNAIEGAPHADWQKAFNVCRGEQDAVRSGFIGLIFIGPVAFEGCGACMANVHINRDLKDALTQITDVDAQDYGNILIFVMRGNIYAETKIRGQAKGALMIMTSLPFAGKLNLDVKAWRNKVFKDCYGKDVPQPSDDFVSQVNKREGI
jgi:hypothetical protein